MKRTPAEFKTYIQVGLGVGEKKRREKGELTKIAAPNIEPRIIATRSYATKKFDQKRQSINQGGKWGKWEGR